MEKEVSTADFARLIDATPKTVADLGKRDLIVKGSGRGKWKLEPSVARYVKHLREEAAARGGDDAKAARARLATAQASLNETKAKQLAGELVEATEVEALWTRKLRGFRNRVLAAPGKVRDLTARQNVTLTQELRAALTELADDAV